MPSDYTSTQVRVPANSIGNSNVATGVAALWGHHQSKICYDGTFYFLIQVVDEPGASTPHNFRIYRIDPRQATPVVAAITFRTGNVYQAPIMVIDRDNRLHVFYIETDTVDASVGTTRTIRHYQSVGAASTLTNAAITGAEWTLVASITTAGLMHGYIGAAFSYEWDTLYLSYVDDNGDLRLRRNPNLAGWGADITVQASSASHIGGQIYRALYAHIVPMGPDRADLLWIRSFNQTNYDQVLYRRVTSISGNTMDAVITILDRSPGAGDTLLCANPYMFFGMDGLVHIMYWNAASNDHYHTSRSGSDAFTTAVAITNSDPNLRAYRQYGVYIEQLNPARLHAFVAPSLASPPDNALAHFWSEDNGVTWSYERDYSPPLASTTLHDYPDLIQTFNMRAGAQDNKNAFVIAYNGTNTIVNDSGNNALRVILELIAYDQLDSDYVADTDSHSIIRALLDSEWQIHFANVPKPAMYDMDNPDIERLDAANGDYIVVKSAMDYEEEQVGHLFLFKSLKIPIEIQIVTKETRVRLLDIRREIARIIYRNQINFAQIGNFHRLRYTSFVQEFDEQKRIWTGTIMCSLEADGIPVIPVSELTV